MEKPRLHFHSDCSFFAGCENMLSNFLDSQSLNDTYEVTFSYRDSEEYKRGLHTRIKRNIDEYPLKLRDPNELYQRFLMRKPNALLKCIAKVILFIPVKYAFIRMNQVELYRFFRQMKPDIVHINNGGHPGACSCMSAVLAAHKAGIQRIVYVVNNIAQPYRSPARWLDYPLDRLMVRYVSKFVTGSKHAGKALKDTLKVPEDKYEGIHNGIRKRSLQESSAQVRKRLDIPADRVVVGMVALLEERKGHRVLIEAVKRLKDSGDLPLPLFLIEGTGPLEEELKGYVSSLGLVREIRFIGHEQHIYDFMNMIDILAVPSLRNEDFPNVVIEAMSLGKMIIASDLAGIPEQIDSMENGLLVGPGDADMLAEGIRLAVKNPLERERMGENARRKFEEAFTAEKAVSRYVSLYHKLMEKKGGK